ncbi:MAG: efflux RND transporter permease subunit [Deltaproteobacteria bacterium]|nr:efflux RND transporter permease subunit [Deltaproteobacteria bacterium]
MNLTGFSVERPVSITMLMMIAIIVGVISLTRLGIDMLPDVDFPTLSVMVRYPGAPSEEVEAIVARPYEGALAAVNGATRLQSTSIEDAAFITVEFEWGTDLDGAAADIRESVAMLEPFMPDDVEAPIVTKLNLGSLPQAIMMVSGMDDPIALRRLMTDTVQGRLERLEGVAQANFMGGRVEEIHVNVDRAALSGSGVSLDQVAMALGAQNLNLPAGRQVVRREEVLLRTVGLFQEMDDIGKIAVGLSPRTMTPIRLSSLAEVVRTTKEVRSAVHAGGGDALMMMIMKESGANPLQVRRAYTSKLEELREVLPESVQFGMLFDSGRAIEMLATSVVESGLVGAGLAVLVMYLFLRAVRPTLTIAVVIPLSLLLTFIPLYVLDESLNMMTMGGLVLGIGMLVDNAVVVIESIYRHLEMGKTRREAAKVGASEVGMAITASTFTTMVVFLPILFSQGLAGQLASGLAITVAASLFASLFVALTIVPMLASVFFSSADEGAVLQEGRRFSGFRERYKRVLGWALRHRALTLAGVGAFTLLSLLLTPLVNAEFMPADNSPIISAKLSFPVGTPMERTEEVAAQIESVFAQFDDVLTVGTQVGVDENDVTAALSDTNPTGSHQAILFARLKESQDRQYYQVDQLKARMREHIPEIEGMQFEYMGMGGMGGSAHDIEVKILGPDFAVLQEWSDRVVERLAEVDGLVDVDTSLREAKPEKHILIDRERAASYGLTVGQVARSLSTATLGTIASRFRSGGEELDIRVQYAKSWRESPEDLEQVLIPTPAGQVIPLGQIASIEDGDGPVRIVRIDQSRVVSIYGSLEGRDLSAVMGDVSKAVAPIEAQLPQGYSLEFGGQYEDMVDAFVQLVLALVLAVLMVYMVMASQFESFSHPFTIMFTMPLALVGVIWLFLLTQTTLSVPTFLGVIMLAGIVVNNGIVLVDYINQLRQRGMSRLDAALEGAATRLRPVLITSLTTIFAMVPMALDRGEGSETMGPLGLTIIGGLSAAMVLTLLVLPVVYTLIDAGAERFASLSMRLLHGKEAL